MAVSRYVTLSKITHCGVDFPPSTPVALSDAYAAPLLAAGAIAAQAGALPSMPAVPGNVVRETVDTAAGGKAKSYLEVTSGLDGRIRFSVNGSQEFPAVGEIGSITYDSAGRVSTYIDQGATW
ncbi:MAG: hypothetical protein JSS57_00300, partial [Proteobacteria bacterium]|nr:hypothetical protein [Pseudomonadota bacterium]